ncbi:hypothetical protein J6590_078951 [Homalodisca vitripennis]|nr:hypothetical protein J6590_078951 [Homalodisca vitripennis]
MLVSYWDQLQKQSSLAKHEVPRLANCESRIFLTVLPLCELKTKQMKQKDEIRIRQAENAIEELEKKCRQRAKLTKLRLEELLEEEEDPDNPAYAPGHY